MQRPNLQQYSPNAMKAFAKSGLPQSFAMAQTDTGFELTIYDVIGTAETNPATFSDALKAANGAPLTVRLSSPGGNVWDGWAMYNLLKSYQGDTTVVVDGVCASIASVIALGADRVLTQETSMWMVHNAWVLTVGNAADLRDAANLLDKIDGNLVAVYSAKTGKPAEDWQAMMAAETWLTAAEAVEIGLVDGVAEAADAREANARLREFGTVMQARAQAMQVGSRAAAAYDPDGDGDDDAAEAVSLIQSAAVLLNEEIAALTGQDDGDEAASAQAEAAIAAKLEMEKALLMRRARIAAMKDF